MIKKRIEYNNKIPGFMNAWKHASRDLQQTIYDDDNMSSLYTNLMIIYKQFEEDNSCKLLPDHHSVLYIEFESEAHYNWFILRWS